MAVCFKSTVVTVLFHQNSTQCRPYEYTQVRGVPGAFVLSALKSGLDRVGGATTLPYQPEALCGAAGDVIEVV